MPLRVVGRAQIILLAAEGLRNDEIALRLSTSRYKVSRWRERYAGRASRALKRTRPAGPHTRDDPRDGRTHRTDDHPRQTPLGDALEHPHDGGGRGVILDRAAGVESSWVETPPPENLQDQ